MMVCAEGMIGCHSADHSQLVRIAPEAHKPRTVIMLSTGCQEETTSGRAKR